MSYYFTACKMCGVILETFPGTDSSEIYSLNLYLFQFLGNGKPGNGGTRKHTVGQKMEYLRNVTSVIHLPGTNV